MLKQILKDLSWWLYRLSDVFNSFPSCDMEEWDEESHADLDASFYLAEIISRQIMNLTKWDIIGSDYSLPFFLSSI